MSGTIKLIFMFTLGVTFIFFLFLTLWKDKKIKTNQVAILNNVANIENGIVTTIDNLKMIYLRIFPISADLYSKREKEILTRELTNRLSGIDRLSFRFIAVSRPVDISGLIAEHQDLLYDATNQVQRDLLKKEISELAKFALEGDVVERQFYFRLTSEPKKELELKKQAQEIVQIFRENRIEVKICDSYEVIKLGNMVAHPQYVHLDDSSIENLLPMLVKA